MTHVFRLASLRFLLLLFATVCVALLPQHSHWVLGDLESENAFLSVILTVACWSPVYAIENIILPLISSPTNTDKNSAVAHSDRAAAIILNTQAAAAMTVGLGFASSSGGNSGDKPLLLLEPVKSTRPGAGNVQPGCYDANVVVGLRALNIIMSGKLALSPIQYAPGTLSESLADVYAFKLTRISIIDTIYPVRYQERLFSFFNDDTFH